VCGGACHRLPSPLPAELFARVPLKNPGAVQAPLFVAHGQEDAVVPFSQAAALEGFLARSLGPG